jgi:putative sigma-54 modulation protein
MNLTFTEKNTKASEELIAYAEKKLTKLDRLFRNEPDAHAAFYTERGRHGVEVTVRVDGDGLFFRVSELTGDPFASVDSAVGAIERQVRKHKSKFSRRIRDAMKESEIEKLPYLPDDSDDDSGFVISRVKRFAIKPMSVEEAILQMNLLNHEFFAFRNEDENEAFAIVYRRRDGTYGQITSLEN